MEKKHIVMNKFGEKIPILLGLTESAAYIGTGWDRKKAKVYLERGQFIEPSIYIGNRPFWTLARVEEYASLLNAYDGPLTGSVKAEIVKSLDGKNTKNKENPVFTG